ncbi:MAG: peptidase M23 [Bacteroidetes bacterium RIFOXYA12_FULL_35_11]|nr:MAG: peptidase M23 [Bacteroidetes bacterium GWF2_35_48]OFY72453.1 MAG: peptidase M23 [Bacteroidetes bacterium RIFOXYA12_FULL_35_11]OFY96393.1 MAG: peptidase M23 [Bacteroidetes bacterium RIFOXYC12_FULL_35_7]OFY97416.1 MAG: peptidase M23 [Bacteroidetes bacterium RIFOXYB2_FULL_35_7]HBX50486.1 peptidase M23 [Bacteroidales bacterium]
MPKSKYKFNPESLSFDKIEISFRKKLKKSMPYFFSSFGGALVIFIIFAYFIDSPKERILIRENKQMKLQMKIINKQMDQVLEVLNDIQYRDDNIYRAIFGAEPISDNVRKAGFGGSNKYKHLQGYSNSDLVINVVSKLDKLTRQLYVQSKSYDEVVKLARNKEEWLKSIPAIQPVLNKDLKLVASFYGWRMDPIYKTMTHHDGIDFAAPLGTDIYATGDGTVATVEYSRGGYGFEIIIDHGFGYKTRYAHLSKMLVSHGQKVKRGELIAKMGSTGKSVGSHLHYEVLKNGRAVDPINYYFLDLTPEQHDKMIEMAAQGGQALD